MSQCYKLTDCKAFSCIARLLKASGYPAYPEPKPLNPKPQSRAGSDATFKDLWAKLLELRVRAGQVRVLSIVDCEGR